MFRWLLAALTAALSSAGFAQTKEAQPPLLRYTVRTPQGERSGRDREAVLKTVQMMADQARAWTEDPSAAKEARSATRYQEGYVEVISRGTDGHLAYTVRDEAGVRTSRNRESALKTRKMTGNQLKAWSQTAEGKAEGRVFEPPPPFASRQTISTARGSVFSRGSAIASDVLKLDDDKIREWVADPQGAKEGRGAIFFQNGYLEINWRSPTGQVLYSVQDEQGNRTSRNRGSVLKTLKMTPDQVRAWAEDEKAVREERAATFFREEYVEVISRGPALEPPRVEQ